MTILPTTLADLARAYREDRLSPVEVVEALLARIEADETNAFITVIPERALESAERAGEALRSGLDRGPLHGVPVGLKDLVYTR
ncbi:MAG: amidase family protein, partial [Rubrobacter sp.]